MAVFNVNIEIDLSPQAKDWIMSALSDATAKLTASVDNAVGRVQADVAALKSQVAALQAKLDAGVMSQAEEDAAVAAIQAAQTKIDALDPTSPATLPSPSP